MNGACLRSLALMSAAIFGNVSSIMLRMYQGTEEYQEMQTSVKEFIRFHQIPKTLANRLIESYLHSRAFTHGIDMNSVCIVIIIIIIIVVVAVVAVIDVVVFVVFVVVVIINNNNSQESNNVFSRA